MELQDGGGHAVINAALDHALDGLGLVLAKGHQDDPAGLHHGLDAHGHSLFGHLVNGIEEALIGLAGRVGQGHDVRNGVPGRAGLVKADMTVKSLPFRTTL